MFHTPQLKRGSMFRCSRYSTLALLSLALPVASLAAGRASKATAEPNAKLQMEARQNAVQQLGKLPIYFERNQGQTDPSVSYLARAGGTRLFLTRDSAVFSIRQGKGPEAVVRMRTVNAQRGGLDEGFERMPGISNYFIGQDSKKWVTDVPQFAKVKRQGVYPGVDMVFYGNQRQLEYDFLVAPGADPSRIELAFDGVDGIRTNQAGDLVLATAAGDFIQKKPKVYQQRNGRQVEVASHYRIGTGKTVRFEVASYDRRQELVIDPTIVFNALVGSSGDDFVRGVAIDSSLNIYVSGHTLAADFPVVGASISPPVSGSTKIVVFKLNSTGSALLYSTYLGGRSSDFSGPLAVDSAGNAILSGSTSSSDYPQVSPFQFKGYGGGNYDGVLTKINASGNAIVFSTFLGGPNDENINALATDVNGNIFVAGITKGSFPVSAGVFQATYGGGQGDCFVAKYTASGSQTYSTYLGGSDVDQCNGIAADSAGNAYVTGFTQSGATTTGGFPTLNADQATFQGVSDAFVTKLKADGTGLLFSTFYGGNDADTGYGITLDSAGAAYVAGSTYSKSKFKTSTGAFQSAPGSQDIHISSAFVAKFSSMGVLTYSTFLSGANYSTTSSTPQGDVGYAIAVDASLNSYITGFTSASDFKLANPIVGSNPNPGNQSAGFLTEMNTTLSGLIYSTYLGGAGATDSAQYAYGLVLDSSANAYVVGLTDSFYYKNTAGALNAGYTGSDIWVAKISASTGTCAVSLGSTNLFAYGLATPTATFSSKYLPPLVAVGLPTRMFPGSRSSALIP